jgi:tRNA (guanine10-N2)-dimethyltransferase
VIQELFQSLPDPTKALQQTKQFMFQSIISPKEHFVVRIKTIDGGELPGTIPILERQIGQIIVNQTGNKVQLSSPDTTFYGIVTQNAFHFGQLLAKTHRVNIAQNKPSTRPFFKPSSMNPLLARALANLLRIRPHMLVLDPFCGTGGMVLEAFNLGARIIAVELDTKTVAGAKQNLRHQGHVIKGDARLLPLRKIDCVLTDPPYGRSASTKGVPLPTLIKSFLSNITNQLPRKGLVCITFPKHFPFTSLLSTSEFDCLEEHSVYVHGSLTRRIYLLKRRSS